MLFLKCFSMKNCILQGEARLFPTLHVVGVPKIVISLTDHQVSPHWLLSSSPLSPHRFSQSAVQSFPADAWISWTDVCYRCSLDSSAGGEAACIHLHATLLIQVRGTSAAELTETKRPVCFPQPLQSTSKIKRLASMAKMDNGVIHGVNKLYRMGMSP